MLHMLNKPEQMATVIVAAKKKHSSGESEGGESQAEEGSGSMEAYDEALHVASADMLQALEEKNAHEFTDALKGFIQICMSHHERVVDDADDESESED